MGLNEACEVIETDLTLIVQLLKMWLRFPYAWQHQLAFIIAGGHPEREVIEVDEHCLVAVKALVNPGTGSGSVDATLEI